MKIHFHRVKTTQLLRLPCTHLPKPLGHAEKGRQRKNRTREEREKGMKVIHESGEALDECVGLCLDVMTQCMFMWIQVCK